MLILDFVGKKITLAVAKWILFRHIIKLETRTMRKAFLFACACLLSYPIVAQLPQVPLKNYVTEKISKSSPMIDGQLDDQIWQDARRSGDFVQHEPHEGISPTSQTEFAIVYDEDNLYVGIWAYDPNPDSISRRMSRRDDIEGDLVGVDFDSYNDHRTSFGFWVSASGVKLDRIMTGDGDTEDPTWDPNWFVKTHITHEGWTAEMKIPFSQLRFEINSTEGWGLNLMRYVFRNDEVSIWQRIPKGSGGFVSYYGNMTGLSGIEPKKQFDITPYTVASTERYEVEEGNPYRTGKGTNYTVGLDAKVGVTNNLTLDLTINPDFGQVEADPSEVNLTAYETFFEEKRPFFIEGRSILSMPLMIGDGDLANENLFYTRRIGRRPQGSPDLSDDEYAKMPSFTRILGAAKMTGKTENGWSVGMLESVTAHENAKLSFEDDEHLETVEPLTNYFVGSVGKDFNEGNTVIKGLITSVNRRMDDHYMDYLHQSAYTGGVEFSQLLKNKTYLISFKTFFSQVNGTEEALLRTQTSSAHYFQRPDAEHISIDSTRTSMLGNGGSLMLGKVGNSKFNFGGFLNWKSPGVELNDMGFIRNTDQILPILWGNYRFFEPFSIFRMLRFNSSLWSEFNFSGTFQGVGGNINANAQFTNFWNFGIGVNVQNEALSTGMLRGGPSFLEPASVTSWMSIGTDSRKKLMFRVSGFAPRSMEDHSKTTGGEFQITYRPLNMLQIVMEPNFTLNKSNLQYIEENSYQNDPRYVFGSIDQKVIGLSLRLNLTITPDLTIQYWGQPFIASGSYSDIKMITDPTAENYTDRFHVYNENQINVYKDDGYCNIDENADGIVDYSVDYPDFNFKEFKSNLVARWEFRPGSILYLVWSQGRNSYQEYGGMDIGRDFNELYRVYPHNVFLVKFSYRFGL